jgi:type III restriction enzyme
MKFLKENKQIKRHIGFTGTPYNNNDFFADVIFDYSIRTAIDEKYIKAINPLIKVNTEEGDNLSSEQRYEVIFKNHLENKEKYSYKDKDGLPRVKPITIFICSDTKKARSKMEEFIDFLIKKNKKDCREKTKPELRDMAIEKVILVTCNNP